MCVGFFEPHELDIVIKFKEAAWCNMLRYLKLSSCFDTATILTTSLLGILV